MISWLLLVSRILTGIARSRASLAAENAVLRHQLAVLQLKRPWPFLRPADRVLWIWLCRHWDRWRYALVLIQPATVLRWHRGGYRRYWRRRSGGLGGRPRIPRPHISLIRRISSDHPEWGEDRIALELKTKLGVEHAVSTIRRYMVTRKGGGSPVSPWSTFLTSHASELWTMDLTTQPLWNYSVRYVLVLMELRSRRVGHVAVTASPTLAWVKQRIREARVFRSAAQACRGRHLSRQGRVRSRSWHTRCSAASTTTTNLPHSASSPLTLRPAQLGPVVPGHALCAGF